MSEKDIALVQAAKSRVELKKAIERILDDKSLEEEDRAAIFYRSKAKTRLRKYYIKDIINAKPKEKLEIIAELLGVSKKIIDNKKSLIRLAMLKRSEK